MFPQKCQTKCIHWPMIAIFIAFLERTQEVSASKFGPNLGKMNMLLVCLLQLRWFLEIRWHFSQPSTLANPTLVDCLYWFKLWIIFNNINITDKNISRLSVRNKNCISKYSLYDPFNVTIEKCAFQIVLSLYITGWKAFRDDMYFDIPRSSFYILKKSIFPAQQCCMIGK